MGFVQTDLPFNAVMSLSKIFSAFSTSFTVTGQFWMTFIQGNALKSFTDGVPMAAYNFLAALARAICLGV